MSTPRKERCHWSCIGKPDGKHSTSCPASFTAPTKRTHGPCTCAFATIYWVAQGEPRTVTEHAPDCPAIYPAQQEPDALTRLVRYIRSSTLHEVEKDEALSLISEVREEQRKALVAAKNDGLEVARKMVSNMGFKNLASIIEAAKGSTP